MVKNKHTLYCFGKDILIGITYPITKKIWSGPSYTNGIKYLEPKINYFRQSVRNFGDFLNPSDIKEKPICAYITFRESYDKSNVTANLKKNDVNKTYLNMNIEGKLTELEAMGLAAQAYGKRSVDLESIIGKVVNLASSLNGYISLHGGATIDEKNKEIYVVVGSGHGIGKTTLLFDFIRQGQKMISNSLRLRINKNRQIFVYPQFYPLEDEFFYMKPPRTYAGLKKNGFIPEALGIKEISSNKSHIPLSKDETILAVPAVKNKIKLTDDYKLIIINPKTVDMYETDICPTLTKFLGETIKESWEATWSFDSIIAAINSSTTIYKIEKVVSEIILDIIKKRKHFLKPLTDKINKFYFEVNIKNSSAVLPAVKEKINNLANKQ